MSTAQSIPVISPKEAKAIARASLTTRHPVMFWGEPGGGKSSIVFQAAEEEGIQVIDWRLVQMDAVDVRGLPYKKTTTIGKDGTGDQYAMAYAQPSQLPTSGRGFLFMDELPQANTLTQNAASELLLDRRIGDYRFPDGWMVIAAGNPRSSRAGTVEVPSHLRNRLTHFTIKPDVVGWLEYAKTKKFHPDLIRYIESDRDALAQFNADAMASPTARTWEFVSDYMKADLTVSLRNLMIQGAVGIGYATKLIAFMDMGKDLPSYADVIANPSKAPVPTGSAQRLQLVNMVVANSKVEDAAAISVYLDKFPKEMAKMAVAKLLVADKAYIGDKDFRNLAEKVKSN